MFIFSVHDSGADEFSSSSLLQKHVPVCATSVLWKWYLVSVFFLVFFAFIHEINTKKPTLLTFATVCDCYKQTTSCSRLVFHKYGKLALIGLVIPSNHIPSMFWKDLDDDIIDGDDYYYVENKQTQYIVSKCSFCYLHFFTSLHSDYSFCIRESGKR